MAIVGMDVSLGGSDGLAEFEWAIYSGEMGHCLEDDGTLGEEQLLSKVTRRALAGISDLQAERIAGLFSYGSVLAAGNLSGVPAGAGPEEFIGECINLSAQGNPLAVGLARAADLLDTHSADAVLLGAVSLGKDMQPAVEKGGAKINLGKHGLGFDREVDGWTGGEGAAAVVLMRHDAALAAGKRVYAVVEAFAWVLKDGREPKAMIFPTFLNAGTIQQSCELAFDSARTDPGRIGYLEVLGSGFAPVDAAEISGITRAYALEKDGLSCALGSAQSQAGYLFNSAGLVGLIRTAICLYERWIPGNTGWTGPKKPELWSKSPFYVASETRTWFLPHGETRRMAALNSIGWDGSCVHLVMGEEPSQLHRPNLIASQSEFYLFPVAGADPADVVDGLQRLKGDIETTHDLRQTARQTFTQFQQTAEREAIVSIVGRNAEEVLREIEHGLREVPVAQEKKRDWQSPQGSFYTIAPVGKQGSVSFVYPGAFNSYIGLGRDLFILFPQLYERALTLTAELGVTIQDEMLYPRSLEALSKEQLAELEVKLNTDAIAMITSGSLIAVFFTMILQDVFKIKADAAFGYSLGEIAMLFGTGAWGHADATRRKLQTSELFRTRLSGAQNAVRENWGVDGVDIPGDRLWSNYFLMAPCESVREAVQKETRVYLTHINTPRQVVIGGDPAACQRVIAGLKCTSLKAPFDFALHCEAMRSEYEALVELHTLPLAATPEMRLYSAAENRPLPYDSQLIGEKIAHMLCSSLDFPALVHQTYTDGARVFIELGANANCSKWIDDTLKGQPALAVSINRKGVDDHTSIVRMLAKLVSHQVDVDLSVLYA